MLLTQLKHPLKDGDTNQGDTDMTTATTRVRITGRTADDVIRAIYKAEGWPRVEGERRVARCKTLYDFTADTQRNRYVASRKPA